jgi:hypothetical protein
MQEENRIVYSGTELNLACTFIPGPFIYYKTFTQRNSLVADPGYMNYQ